MFARPFATLLLITALAVPAFAQEQRGSIEGVVKDASGAVLPGATVEAKSHVGRRASTTTDADRRVPFPVAGARATTRSRPTCQGFKPREVVDVRVGSVRSRRSISALPLSGVTETVQVTARIADDRRRAEPRADQHPRRDDRSAAEGPRLHVAGDAGARRQPGKPQRRHLDRRRVGGREQVLSSTASTRRTSGPASRRRRSSPTSSKKCRSSRPATPRNSAARRAASISVISKSGTNEFRGEVGVYFNNDGSNGDLALNNTAARRQRAGSGLAQLRRHDRHAPRAAPRAERRQRGRNRRVPEGRLLALGSALPARRTDRARQALVLGRLHAAASRTPTGRSRSAATAQTDTFRARRRRRTWSAT